MSRDLVIDLVQSLKERTPSFVSDMQVLGQPGKYRLSWSGDIVPERAKWGLGQATFATRVLFIFDQLEGDVAASLLNFIKSFETPSGKIFDPYVARTTRTKRWIKGALLRDRDLLFNKLNERAELRQALAALINLDGKPERLVLDVPITDAATEAFVQTRDWLKPWGAGSHVNHQLFFLRYFVEMSNARKLGLARSYFEAVRNNGKIDPFCTEADAIPPKERVGGLMKLLMAADLFGSAGDFVDNGHVDVCLDKMDAADACEHFNTIYVLGHCHKHLDYRREEIEAFAIRMGTEWRDHYFPEYGGFSFGKGQSSQHYYGAVLTKGLAEPDLHGTAMFVWGLLFVTKILGVDTQLGLKVPVL